MKPEVSRSAAKRLLDVGPVRAFEVVARRLSFSAAAQELFLTQSAVSRQIQSLEAELGVKLFHRGTRHVALTFAGQAFRDALVPALGQIDSVVQQLRLGGGRTVVNVSTFASMASLWLLPRLEAFQAEHPGSDIRVSSQDALIDLSDPEHDVLLRYCTASQVPPTAVHLFGEVLTPVISPWVYEKVQRAEMPPLNTPSDLAWHTLIEQDESCQLHAVNTWRLWLQSKGLFELEPRTWLYLSYTYQQMQAALAGQGVALAPLALVAQRIQQGELVEPFGVEGRSRSSSAYWMLVTRAGADRQDVQTFMTWVQAQAALTCQAMTHMGDATT